jgi:uncharacterized protein (TIGR02246 family)
MVRRLLTLGVTAVALAACESGAAEFSTADSLAVDSVRLAYMNAYNAGNVGAVAALYTEDALSYQGDQPPLSGRAAVSQTLTAELARSPGARLDIGATRVEGDDDMAIVAGPFSVRMGAGDSALTMNGKYVVVLRKSDDGRWLIAYNSSSLNAPLPPSRPPN